jgi:hypothetical protein
MPKVESAVTVYRGYLAERLLSRRIVRTKEDANQIIDALLNDM